MPKDNVDSLDLRNRCSLKHYDMLSKDPLDIVQTGWCPEGSSCQCPKLYVYHERSIAELRRSTFYTFVPKSAAIVPVFFAQFQDDLLVDTLTYGLEAIITNTVSAAVFGFSSLGAEFATLSYVISMFISGFQTHFEDADDWTCASSVGCWPVDPEMRRTPLAERGCQVPQSAQSGGSPYWFLPPPLLMINYDGFLGRRRCDVRYCSEEAMRDQQVGFGYSSRGDRRQGKPDVFNCQPLAFAEMTPEQRASFEQSLACSGIFEEYDMPDGVQVDLAACP